MNEQNGNKKLSHCTELVWLSNAFYFPVCWNGEQQFSTLLSKTVTNVSRPYVYASILALVEFNRILFAHFHFRFWKRQRTEIQETVVYFFNEFCLESTCWCSTMHKSWNDIFSKHCLHLSSAHVVLLLIQTVAYSCFIYFFFIQRKQHQQEKTYS